MKKIFGILLLMSALAVFGGCSANLNAGGGSVLSVDANGHFLDDVSYSTYNKTAKFNKDGTYEFIYWGLEATNGAGVDINSNKISNEGRVQTSGSKGTYVYTASNYYMALTCASDYVSTNGAPMTYLPSQYTSMGATGVFTSQSMYYLIALMMMGMGNGSMPMSKVGDDSSKNYAMTVKVVFTNGQNFDMLMNGTFDFTGKTFSMGQSTAQYVTVTSSNYIAYGSTSTGTMLTNYPAGVNFDVGQNVTYRTVTAQTVSYTNTNANGSSLWVSTNNQPSYTDQAIANYGRFILIGGVSPYAMKSLAQ